jgi:hypothetical protein
MTTLSTLPAFHRALLRGLAIPAHPLALTSARKLDERRQRALSRYHLAAGAGGLAVAVHTTQFAIREPKHALLKPVLQLAKEEFDRADSAIPDFRSQISNLESEIPTPHIRIAGVCGRTPQAVSEAQLARDLAYHAGLLSLAAMKDATDEQLLAHCKAVSDVIPIIGFYLQPAVGGRLLPYSFWRRLAELPNLIAIKIAPFNRYQTLDVLRAVAESGRSDIALYTGNDDNIVLDLITPFRFHTPAGPRELRITGGLLGHWSVWTQKAVNLLQTCHAATQQPGTQHSALSTLPHSALSTDLLRLAVEVTDSNAAFFDAANSFRGCIAGLHEVLRRQRLLEGIWCLDDHETLSPGQAEEIDRVYQAYPHLNDDDFVAEYRDEWLRG